MRLLAVALSVLALAGCKAARHAARDGDAPVDGAALFARTCAPCHGPLGRGDPRQGAPDLTAPASREKTDEALRHRVKFGAGRMPPFGGAFDEAEMDALVLRVRALQR